MEEKFRNKYRSASTRLPGFDYGSDNFYFVTICVKDRRNFFGEICDGRMCLNEFGRAVEQCWTNIPHHFPFIDFDEFVVMPDHVHGILIFDKYYFFGLTGNDGAGAVVETPNLGVSTTDERTCQSIRAAIE
jgi:hypothetical protein